MDAVMSRDASQAAVKIPGSRAVMAPPRGMTTQHDTSFACRFKHRMGQSAIDPELEIPAPVADCPECHGCGVIYDKNLERAGWLYPNCPVCCGSDVVTVPAVRPAA
jgi:hypothetical protein